MLLHNQFLVVGRQPRAASVTPPPLSQHEPSQINVEVCERKRPVVLLQNSFYKLMMGDNKSEKFFKVLHDRMKEAQTDIKATVSVNVGEMTHKANEKELENGEIHFKTSQILKTSFYSFIIYPDLHLFVVYCFIASCEFNATSPLIIFI